MADAIDHTAERLRQPRAVWTREINAQKGVAHLLVFGEFLNRLESGSARRVIVVATPITILVDFVVAVVYLAICIVPAAESTVPSPVAARTTRVKTGPERMVCLHQFYLQQSPRPRF